MLDDTSGLGRIAFGTGAAVAVTFLWLFAVKVPTEHVEQPAQPAAKAADGLSLFRTHCAACHGEEGDGNGTAARFLYPRPRDFSAADFRLVTTVNLIPTDDDLMKVIDRGMPGSAMVPFAHLPQEEKQALVGHVRELTLSGMLRKAVSDAKGRGEVPDEPALKEEIKEFFKPGPKVDLPSKWPNADEASVDRGQKLYVNNCATCHGVTGKGDGAQDQRDSSGMPTPPRDFARGIYKGGRDRESLYARIVLGMKGTPMPANPSLKPDDVGDVINFMNSLSAKEVQVKIEHKRTAIVARRVYGALPEDLTAVWAATQPAAIVVSPLWWRDYMEPDFRVWAAHDGKTIAIRLAWFDSTKDDQVSHTDQFEDMAAIQLFRGQPEPFLGMGADGAAPDLWLWRASWQRPNQERAVYDAYTQLPDFTTARAARNPNAHVDQSQSASNLAAKGAGSVTFRPKASQVVSARSTWSDRRWMVEFRRPLHVPSDSGIALASGQSASIAFAIWDGAAHDRNGQKKISIWHDLRLE